MNLNEVIATLDSSESLALDANDHVNMWQSSYDVFPSAIHVAACLQVHEVLLPAMLKLENALLDRAGQHRDTIKTGRTHLMDAMPLSLGQEISAWASLIKNDRYRVSVV